MEIVHTTQEITLISQNLSPFWPYDVILTPKMHFLNILSNFLKIFAYLTTRTSKLSYKTMEEIVHITQEITLKYN